MSHIELKTIPDERYSIPASTKKILLGVFIIGVILSIIGIFMLKNGAHPVEGSEHAEHAKSWAARIWANLLLNSWYTFMICIIGAFFVALNYLSNAGWAVAFKRIPESFSAAIPFTLVALLITGFFGMHDLYHWTDEAAMLSDSILQGKSAFLNKGMLFIGTIVMFLVYIVLTRKLRSLSLKEDAEGNPLDARFLNSSVTYSAIFMVFFGFSFFILSWLWMMSLDAHWFSTIFSVYNFAIAFVCGLVAITFFVLHLKKHGYLSIVSDEHIHDLGKFTFAFSIFWTYIWISQYLLIWYANIPEESIYFVLRKEGTYEFMFWLNFVVCFVAPFLGLMTRNAKRNPTTLVIVGSLILIGHWLDLYLMIFPAAVGEDAGIGILEIGMPMVFFSIFVYIVLNSLTKANLFPKNHPYLHP